MISPSALIAAGDKRLLKSVIEPVCCFMFPVAAGTLVTDLNAVTSDCCLDSGDGPNLESVLAWSLIDMLHKVSLNDGFLDKVKRVGVGGRLVPFFKCVCVYFLAMGGGWDPSPTAVAAKCAPILCLLLVVILHQGSLGYEKGWYARRIAVGLVLSALGDALLVWPQHFVAGMAAFAGAHIAYIAAFGFYPLKPILAPICYAACAYYMTLLSPPEGLKILVPVYGMLLTTMAWRGLARGRAAAAGAFLFLISDAILGYSLFGGPLQYKQVLVMSTYYLGQLGIALSALETAQVTVP